MNTRSCVVIVVLLFFLSCSQGVDQEDAIRLFNKNRAQIDKGMTFYVSKRNNFSSYNTSPLLEYGMKNYDHNIVTVYVKYVTVDYKLNNTDYLSMIEKANKYNQKKCMDNNYVLNDEDVYILKDDFSFSDYELLYNLKENLTPVDELLIGYTGVHQSQIPIREISFNSIDPIAVEDNILLYPQFVDNQLIILVKYFVLKDYKLCISTFVIRDLTIDE